MSIFGLKLDKKKRSHLIEILSHVLNELCHQVYSPNMSGNTCNCFDSIDPPPINLKCYLKRIASYTGCSEESLIFSLIYIDRLITNREHRFLVTNLNVHRLLLSSVLVAVKFYDDHYYNNVFFSKVGGVSTKELNMLETEFLFLINFDLSVDSEMYARYNKRLMSCQTRLSCKWNPSLPAEVTKTFAIKLVTSLPLKKPKIEFRISNAAKGTVAFHPERPDSPSTSDFSVCDDLHVHTKVQQPDNHISNIQNVGKCRPGFNDELTFSVGRRCSNMALFLKPLGMKPIKVLPC